MAPKRCRRLIGLWFLATSATAATTSTTPEGTSATPSGGSSSRSRSLEASSLSTILTNLETDTVRLVSRPADGPSPNDNSDSPVVCSPASDTFSAATTTHVPALCEEVEHTYVKPCSSPAAKLQEATAALLAARALAKTGGGGGGGGGPAVAATAKDSSGGLSPSSQNIQQAGGNDDDGNNGDGDGGGGDYSSISWKILDSLLTAGGTNGFVPRFRYPASSSSSDDYSKVGIDDEHGYGLDCGGAPAPPSAAERRSAVRQSERQSEQQQPQQPPPPLPYLPNTSYPSPALFGSPPLPYRPPSLTTSSSMRSSSMRSSMRVPTSGRISSPPFHSTLVLETFYLSNQTDADLKGLGRNWERLLRWHAFLHDGVMRGCGGVDDDDDDDGSDSDLDGSDGGSGGGRGKNREGGEGDAPPTPCYNTVHPYETPTLPSNSPLWSIALRPIIEHIDVTNWTVPFDVPPEVTGSYDYPGKDVYGANMWLLECHRRAAAEFGSNSSFSSSSISTSPDGNGAAAAAADQTPQPQPQPQQDYRFEPYLISRCPFALLDVSHAAALSRSDSDLLQIGRILRDEGVRGSEGEPTKVELETVGGWSVRSRKVLDSLWDGERGAYLSRLVTFEASPSAAAAAAAGGGGGGGPDGSNGTRYAGNGSIPLDVAVSGNFGAAWDDVDGADAERDSRVTAMTYQLLQREGKFGYSCGEYPIWSVGGCNTESEAERGTSVSAAAAAARPIIDPTLNYLVSTGLIRNGAEGLGRYIRNSTLDLICGLPNLHSSNLTTCSDSVDFAAAYDAQSAQPASADSCGRSSTATAAVVYSMFVPDKAFAYRPAPPLSSSWVIFLIAIELAVAFGIGVSCLVLSVHMMRRIKADDDTDEFVRLLRSQRADASFLYGEIGDGPYGGGGGGIVGHGAGSILSDRNRILAGNDDLGDDDEEVNSAAAASGVGAELERLQNCPESPIIRAASPLRTVQRFLYRDMLRSPFRSNAREDEAVEENQEGVISATEEAVDGGVS